ncbi:exosortase-associated protein EpsI, V-type [uncultured Rhodoblastus sp.]|uniref:exosortase-associated protein EpsI, V-type n=1 Tax=uncultured Rhodoblastus sp. TaxID=543037 RepID=UPI002600E40D|nr:exosortase-associated protein EpsI, V-type [uncultured Rhodoblastus sp.]
MNIRSVNIIAAIALILGAAVAAQAMIPQRKLGKAPTQEELERMIPKSFGQWTYEPQVRMVEPPGSDTLSKQIYNAELARGYRDPEGRLVMFLVAYGASQSDRLQLHRPEICYAAQGFRVERLTTVNLDLGDGLPNLPVRHLLAERENRQEPITYWMRIGDTVATNAVERQVLKVEYGLRGYISDGALVRLSTVGLPEDQAYALQTRFLKDFLHSVDSETRRFLIGDPDRALRGGF